MMGGHRTRLWLVLAWVLLAVPFLPAAQPALANSSVLINELEINPPGADSPFEYVELRGQPGSTISNLYFAALEGDVTTPATRGRAEFVVALNNQTIGSNGILVIASSSGGHTFPAETARVGDAQLDAGGVGIENATSTFLLISSATPIVEGTDYDANDDGVLDADKLGAAVVQDAVAWSDGDTGDLVYSSVVLNQDSGSPDAATRFANNTDANSVVAWYNGNLSGSVSSGTAYAASPVSVNFPANGALTPGAPNVGVFAAPTAISACGDTFTHTYEIQGTGDKSPKVDTSVVTEGVVTGDFQGGTKLNGFFIQDAAGDSDPATSDGLFVRANGPDIAPGATVRLVGEVIERNGATQLQVANILVCSVPAAAIAPTPVDLPVGSVADLERYENMLVTFPEQLFVTENFQLGRFGELMLAATGRLINPTEVIDPNDDPPSGVNFSGSSNVAAISALQASNNRRSILLDDGSSASNPAAVPYLNAQNTRRIGDSVSNLTGVLGYDFGEYRVHPTVAPVFADTNPRPTAAPTVGGNIKVASFNVLNYFNTFNQTGSTCYPNPPAQDNCRGANSQAEFDRQRAKIFAALRGLDADVVGLIELENDGDGANSAIADLVNGLNASIAAAGGAANTYAYIADPEGYGPESSVAVYPGGDDAIKVALIYKPANVMPQGAAVASPDEAFANARAPIAQTFSVVSTGKKFSVVINHFKSKSSCPSPASDPNADQGDGQGCWNASRVAQASALLSFINGTVIPAAGDLDVVVLGDLNAYSQEDPVDRLRAGGLVDVSGADSYSYTFDGQAGALDHALVSANLQPRVTGAAEWHINADEPLLLDYNLEFKPSSVAALYEPTPYRASDHDPVLVGLNLPELAVDNPIFTTSTITSTESSVRVGEELTYVIRVVNTGFGGSFMLNMSLDPRLEVVSAAGFTRNGQTLTLSGQIAPNEQQVYQVTVRVKSQGSGPLTNSVTITGGGATTTLNGPAVVVGVGQLYLPIIRR